MAPQFAPRLADVLAKLKIEVLGVDSIRVDAVDVMVNPNQVRIWHLDRYLASADVWGHWQSGTEGPLAEALVGIALCYLPAGETA